jgi:hypothetical protein
VIEHLEATNNEARGGSQSSTGIVVKFTARDAATSVERAQYSVDGGDWILVSPSGKISGAQEEKYEFTVVDPSQGEHTIAVRALDRFENVGSAKTTVNVGKPSRR